MVYETEDKSDSGVTSAVIARSAGAGENYKSSAHVMELPFGKPTTLVLLRARSDILYVNQSNS